MIESEARWGIVELWWEDYVQNQESSLVELRERVEKLNQLWVESDSRFDQDPLGCDWSETTPQAGPLRTGQEENWSQWLAHLLRDSSGNYCANLLGPNFDNCPSRVRCERAYHDEELHDRRVDILGEFKNRGVTIEVKIGDENYWKTPQTAHLTEKHHQQDLNWTHYLLLPKAKHSALAEMFGDRLNDDESNRSTIKPNNSEECEITVLYWSEVSQSLRSILLANEELDPHWCASAYVYTTLIEQQILEFYPLSSLQKYQQSSIGVSDIDRLRSIQPTDQIEYLNDHLEVINNG